MTPDQIFRDIPSQSCLCMFLVLISLHVLSFFNKYFYYYIIDYGYVGLVQKKMATHTFQLQVMS